MIKNAPRKRGFLLCALHQFRIKNPFRRHRVFGELAFRPRRAFLKIAAAVGAGIVQNIFYARLAEGAFKRADHCIGCAVRKILVAAFATGPYLKHKSRLACIPKHRPACFLRDLV